MNRLRPKVSQRKKGIPLPPQTFFQMDLNAQHKGGAVELLEEYGGGGGIFITWGGLTSEAQTGRPPCPRRQIDGRWGCMTLRTRSSPEDTGGSEQERRFCVFISTYPEYVKGVYESVRKRQTTIRSAGLSQERLSSWTASRGEGARLHHRTPSQGGRGQSHGSPQASLESVNFDYLPGKAICHVSRS